MENFSFLEGLTEPARRLAEVASLATEIEPALLRRLRRDLDPGISPIAEAELWSSDLASSRSPAALILGDAALNELRINLARDQDRLDAARAIVVDAHGGIAPVLRYEEDLVYFGLVDLTRKPRDGIDDEKLEHMIRERLDAVVRSITIEPDRRNGLLSWSSRALRTLPVRVRSHNTAMLLTALRVGHERPGQREVELPLPSAELDLKVAVRWFSEGLRFSIAEDEAGGVLSIPDIEPHVVDVRSESRAGVTHVHRIFVRPKSVFFLPLESATTRVELRSLRGNGLALEHMAEDVAVAPTPHQTARSTTPTSPIPTFRNRWVVVAGPARKELRPAEMEEAVEVGRALAREGLGLITAAFPGVDFATSRAFVQELEALGAASGVPDQRIRRVVAEGRIPAFHWGELRAVRNVAEEYWVPLMEAASAVIIGSQAGTRRVARYAACAGKPAYALPGTFSNRMPAELLSNSSDGSESAARRIAGVIASQGLSEVESRAGDLLDLARNALSPQEIVGPRTMDQLSKEIIESRSDASAIAEISLRGASLPERLIGFLAAQGQQVPTALLIDALHREINAAARVQEGRVLEQGIRALEWQVVSARGKHEPALAEQVEYLIRMLDQSKIGSDRLHHDLLKRVRSRLDVGANRFTELAQHYEDLRRRLPGGSERTRLLNDLVSGIRKEAQSGGVTKAEIGDLYSSGQEGMRIVALASCIELPELAPPAILNDAVLSPKTPFEQWTALLAMRACMSQQPGHKGEAIAAAVMAALDDPPNIINHESDASRRGVADEILSAYAAYVGLQSKSDPDAFVDHIRRWLAAAVKHPADARPCMVISGSDKSGRQRHLARALGMRLAHYGWKLNAGLGVGVGAEALEGFVTVNEKGAAAFTVDDSKSTRALKRSFRTRDEMRSVMMAEADCVIAIGGGRGTQTECEIALDLKRPVLAVALTGGSAHTMRAISREALLPLRVPQFMLNLLDADGDPELCAERFIRVANIVLEQQRTLPPHKSSRRNKDLG